jgi:membrane-associated HD superfamily phosphohydrolase
MQEGTKGGSAVPISANHIHFFISYAVAFLVFALIARWYVWPAIRDRAPQVALTPLLLYACLRINGLMFLMTGLVSPDLPSAFAVPTAYGDVTAAVLALLAIACLRTASPLAMPMVWLFNVAGFLDLVYANISQFRDSVDPVQLGVSYYLAVINVPAMVVVHVMIFVYLLRRRPKAGELPA